VAHALKALPEISAAFASGRLSYSKVRALTRVAHVGNERELLSFAKNVSAALVEQRCQQLKNTEPDSHRPVNQVHARRALVAYRNGPKGSMTLSMEVSVEDGELVLNALDKVLAAEADRADASTSYRARQADALIELCRRVLVEGICDGAPAVDGEATRDDEAASDGAASLNGSARGAGAGDGGAGDSSTSRVPGPGARSRPSSSADLYQVVVHTDAAALAGEPGTRSDLPVETVRRLTCDGAVVPVANDANGTPVGIGRKRRTVSTTLKRALLSRDRHCRYPGCTRSRFVDAHHVQHWAAGGATDLDNLLLLCDHHHRLVHEGGFGLFVDCDGKVAFRRPDSRAVPAAGYRLEDTVDEEEAPAEPSAEGRRRTIEASTVLSANRPLTVD